MTLIAFAGLKGSGKDTAADALIERGFTRLRMAGALKDMLASLFRYQGASGEMIHRLLEGDLKETPTPLLNGRTTRHAMQTLGTLWGRDTIDQNLWVDATARRVAQFPNVVISDVRFPNEVTMVKDLGGVTYLIERGLVSDDLHPSEALVLELDVDAVIPNSVDSVEAFHAVVLAALDLG